MIRSIFLLVLFLVVGIHAGAQTKTVRIDSLMHQLHRYNMFDGSVLVAENGKVIYKKAFGLANREWNIANTPDTKFMIGSITKQFSAMLALLQIQKGKLRMDGQLKDYIPEFVNDQTSSITVEQLMNNTGGFANYEIIADFFPRISRQFFEPKEYIKLYKDSALLSPPGTAYYYSSWGFFTLGYLLERVTGKTYRQLLQDEIFSKLGMSSSGTYDHRMVLSKRASGYEYFLGSYKSADFRDQSNAMATGDMYSTVEDLYRWSTALTNHTLLNKELTSRTFTPGKGGYGYGWFIYPVKLTSGDSVTIQGHAGQTDGFNAMISRIPKTNSLVVFLCNGNPAQVGRISNLLVNILHNQPVSLKVPLAKSIAPLIQTNGVTIALERLGQLKTDTARYSHEWEDIDNIGKELVDVGRFEEALQVFQQNALDFPDHSRIHNSLGYVYFKMGNYMESRRHFLLTLQRFPQNGEAKAMLANSLLK